MLEGATPAGSHSESEREEVDDDGEELLERAEAVERATAVAAEQLRALEATLHGQDSAALEEAVVAAKAILDESELQSAVSALQRLRAKDAERAALLSAKDENAKQALQKGSKPKKKPHLR